MGSALERMLHSIDDLDAYRKADFDFHLAIAKASKNKIIREATPQTNCSPV